MESTRKKLGISLICFYLTLVTLLGSTYAWFTDSVSNTGNRIQAGTLDVDLLEKEDGKYVSVESDVDPIFNYDKWDLDTQMQKSSKLLIKVIWH